MTDTLIELAERCEKATGPDRELDLAIHRQINPEHVTFMDADLAKGMAQLIALGGDAWEKRKEALFRETNRSPRYTSSLDAAMTLVPANCCWSIIGPLCSGPDKPDHFGADVSEFLTNPEYPEVRAATPALALCVAALRARAAQGIDARSGETRSAA